MNIRHQILKAQGGPHSSGFEDGKLDTICVEAILAICYRQGVASPDARIFKDEELIKSFTHLKSLAREHGMSDNSVSLDRWIGIEEKSD